MQELQQPTQETEIGLHLTDEQRKNLHTCFNRCRSVAGVAVELSLTEEEVGLIVRQYPEFEPYVVEPEEGVVDYHSVPQAAAVRSEEGMFRKSLKDAGVKDDMLDTMQAYHRLGSAHSPEVGAVMSGGLVKQFAAIMEDTDEVRSQLAKSGMDLEREQVLREDRNRLMRLTLDLAKSYRESAVLEKKLAEGHGIGGRSKRPGFGPLSAVQVNVNASTNGKPATEAEPIDTGRSAAAPASGASD